MSALIGREVQPSFRGGPGFRVPEGVGEQLRHELAQGPALYAALRSFSRRRTPASMSIVVLGMMFDATNLHIRCAVINGRA